MKFSKWLQSLKDFISKRGWVALAALMIVLGTVVAAAPSAMGQIELSEQALASQVVEPSNGASQTVFEIRFVDTDPVTNDADGVVVQCILVQNLGSANANDITNVVLQGSGVQTPSVVMAQTPPIGAPPSNCPEGSASATNVAFEAFFDKATLDASGFGGSADDIADDGSLNLQIAVQVNNSVTLSNGAQGHTLKLRVVVLLSEDVGSPPVTTNFTDSITDSVDDQINNGGINDLNAVNFTANTIKISSTGLVGSFMICDNDANTLDLSLNSLVLVQGDLGDALNSDFSQIDLIQVGSGTVGSVLPNSAPNGADLNRGGVGLVMPLTVTISDNQCQIFQLQATVAGTAQRGRRVQLNVTFLASEGEDIALNVAPSLQVTQSVLIGSGIVSIPDTQVADGSVPINVSDFPLPGLGTLNVQTQSVQFDPSIFQVDSITPVSPYLLTAFAADNRAGTLKFTLSVDPAQSNSATIDGTIAMINVSRKGNSGQSSLFLFVVDQVLDANNSDVTTGIVVTSGFVEVLTPGDVDFDSRATVRDALIVATSILPCTSASPTILNLTDVQKKSADVAPTQAAAGQTPTCVELNSADVRAIARLAILFGITGADTGVAAAASQPATKPIPWWKKLLRPVLGAFGLLEAPAQALLQSDGNFTALQLHSERGVKALQGSISYDPKTVQIESVVGLNGHEVLAAEIDNTRGELRFATLADTATNTNDVLGIQFSKGNSDKLRLRLDYVLDSNANAIAIDVVQPAPSSTATPLVVSKVGLKSTANIHWELALSGQGIESLAVRGFDLSGRQRFESNAIGQSLNWSMQDEQGRPLANGVYLYVVTAMGADGSVWRSEVRKMVLLR